MSGDDCLSEGFKNFIMFIWVFIDFLFFMLAINLFIVVQSSLKLNQFAPKLSDNYLKSLKDFF